MRKLIFTACAAALLAPLPASAQYGRGGYDAPEQMVDQWYRQFLGRRADPGASIWIEQLRSGQQPEAVLSQILGSSEYFTRAGGSPEGFVNRLHRDLAGRPLSRQEAGFWINQLYRSDRGDVVFQMLNRYPQQWGAGSGSGGGSGGGIDPYEPDYRRPLDRYRYR